MSEKGTADTGLATEVVECEVLLLGQTERDATGSLTGSLAPLWPQFKDVKKSSGVQCSAQD